MIADTTFLHIETAAHGGAFGHNRLLEPTEAQCISGNYKMGRINLYGLPIAIEQPRGTYRTGIEAKTGKRWTQRMAAHYGYFSGTCGNDGDGVDCFVGFYPQSETAYVINQNVAGHYDETKVMLAFPDEESARRAYQDSYERGWVGLQSIVPISISQLKWWLKHGDMRHPLSTDKLPPEGLETMTTKVQWDSNALPYDQTIDRVLYDIRRSDNGDGLLLDAVSAQDITDDSDGVLSLDALVMPYATLERKMEVLRGVMERSSQTVKPVAVQITEPFKQRGVANVAALLELSDGQTVSIYFHNPDVTPGKMTGTDEVISWKWLLNKKDITIVVAPERGNDLNIREVARRIMKLAEKNSPAFQRANTKRTERMQGIQTLKDEISGLETELATTQHELEVAKVSAEDTQNREIAEEEQRAKASTATTTEKDFSHLNALENRLSNERARLADAKNDSEREHRTVLVEQAKKEILDERKFLGLPLEGDAKDMPDDVLLAELTKKTDEQTLIDAYIKAWGDEAEQINAAVAAVNWGVIIDNESATAEIKKLQSAANSERPIIKARVAIEAAGMKTWDSRLSGVTETDEFQAQSKAMDAYREAIDKIQAVAKEKLIEAGKVELAALQEDAPLEDAARAIYRKHGIDMGQRSDWASRVITAIQEKDAEALRSILASVGSDSNKASMEVFERAAGFKLAKTQKERAKQIDEWAGITTEKRAEIDAAKDAAWQVRKLEEGIKDTWGWLKSMNVRDGAEVADGQQYLLRQFADGYDEAGSSKKGAATIYGMKKGGGLRFVNNRSFNAFLKSAMAFGGLRKTLESVGAIDSVAHEEDDKAASVDAAYQFSSATDEFKVWLADSLDKPDYSPFIAAKEMDQAAKRNGASVDWGMFSGVALDGVGTAVAELERALDVVNINEPINRAEGNADQANLEAKVASSITEAIGILSEADYGPSEEEIGGLFEAEFATLDNQPRDGFDSVVLDGIDADGYVGKVKKDSKIIARIDIGGDGKAMVFVGESGDKRVALSSGADAVYGDSASAMIDVLFTIDANTAAVQPEVVVKVDAPKEDTSITTPATTEDRQMTADKSLFQSVIDGTVITPDGEGVLSAVLADTLEAAYMRHAGNLEMDDLFEKAITAYTDAELAASATL